MKLSEMKPREAMGAIAAIVPYVKEIKSNKFIEKILGSKTSLKDMSASDALDLFLDAIPSICADAYDPLARVIAFLSDTTFDELDSGTFEDFINKAKSIKDSALVSLFTSSTSSAQVKS